MWLKNVQIMFAENCLSDNFNWQFNIIQKYKDILSWMISILWQFQRGYNLTLKFLGNIQQKKRRHYKLQIEVERLWISETFSWHRRYFSPFLCETDDFHSHLHGKTPSTWMVFWRDSNLHIAIYCAHWTTVTATISANWVKIILFERGNNRLALAKFR